MGEAMKGWPALFLVVATACGPKAERPEVFRSAIDSAAPDADGNYDTALVLRTWEGVDSSLLVQLNGGRPLKEIQDWLTTMDGGNVVDTLWDGALPTLIGPATTPLGFSNVLAFLGAGAGPDSTLAAILGWTGLSGPGHLALLTKQEGHWRRSFTYSGDRRLWIQGRPISAEAGWLLGMEIFVRGDGANARLVAWRVSGGKVERLALADTAEIEAGDFVVHPDGISIESPDYAHALSYANTDPRLEHRRVYRLDGDTVRVTLTTLNPWLDVVDRFYRAMEDGRVGEARKLVTGESLRRTLWLRRPRAPAERGDTAAGWGTVDIWGEPESYRVLVQRGADSVWRITRAVKGMPRADLMIFPALTP